MAPKASRKRHGSSPSVAVRSLAHDSTVPSGRQHEIDCHRAACVHYSNEIRPPPTRLEPFSPGIGASPGLWPIRNCSRTRILSTGFEIDPDRVDQVRAGLRALTGGKDLLPCRSEVAVLSGTSLTAPLRGLQDLCTGG